MFEVLSFLAWQLQQMVCVRIFRDEISVIQLHCKDDGLTNLQTSVKLSRSKLDTLCRFRYVCRTCWRAHSQSRIMISLFIYFFLHLKLGDVCLSRDAQTEKWAQPMQLVNISVSGGRKWSRRTTSASIERYILRGEIQTDRV